MKKFSKSGPPARAERPARKSFARDGAAPKRAYSPRTGDAPKRTYAPRVGAAPKRAYAPRDGDAPKRPYSPRSEGPKRPYAPRAAEGEAPRRSYRRDDDGAAPARSAYGNPYERVQRPRRSEEGEGARAGGRGFTVNLDPDVARVFRGDASVNKALRLVLQLMQVVEGPGPRSERPAPRPRTGYQGSDEARGFSRKPRFEDDADEDVE
jgi:hypothetical protein